MPYIRVNVGNLKTYTARIGTSRGRVNSVYSEMVRKYSEIDKDIKARRNIRNQLSTIKERLKQHKTALEQMENFLDFATAEYTKANLKLRLKAISLGDKPAFYLPWSPLVLDKIPKPILISSLAAAINLNRMGKIDTDSEGPKWLTEEPFNQLEEKIDDKLKDAGLKKDLYDHDKYYDDDGNEISKEKAGFYEKTHTVLEVSKDGKLEGSLWEVGQREDTDGDGMKGYFAVGDAELHGSIAAGLYILDGNGKKIFSPGVNAEVGASFSVLHAEGEMQLLGDDNFGLDAGGEVSVGKVGAEGSIDIQLLGAEGIQANVNLEAEAILAEAEVNVGIDILGGGVEASAGVNIGIGAHAEFGIKDGVVKCDIGASLGIGFDLSFEIDTSGMVNTIVDGAKDIGNAIADGAKDFGNAVVDGAKAVWDKVWPW